MQNYLVRVRQVFFSFLFLFVLIWRKKNTANKKKQKKTIFSSKKGRFSTSEYNSWCTVRCKRSIWEMSLHTLFESLSKSGTLLDFQYTIELRLILFAPIVENRHYKQRYKRLKEQQKNLFPKRKHTILLFTPLKRSVNEGKKYLWRPSPHRKKSSSSTPKWNLILSAEQPTRVSRNRKTKKTFRYSSINYE